MRSIILVTFILCMGFGALIGTARAGDGAALFDSLKCGMCHKPDKKAAAVSLAEIAKVYGDKEKLVKFFKGDKPLIQSDNWGMMKGQFSKITPLSDQEKDQLAEYIITGK